MQLTSMPMREVGSGRRRLRMISPAYPASNIYSRAASMMTSLGPVCIATAVGDIPGWDAELVDENNCLRAPMDEFGKPDHAIIQQTRPADVVGLYGGLTSTIPRLFEVAKIYKAMGVCTIAGGQHFADENIELALRSGIDVLVIGEGDKTIIELLPCLEQGGDLSKIRGIAFLNDDKVVQTTKRELMTEFDDLPIPDFGVLRYGRMKVYPVSGIRGCGMDCEFCTVKGKPRFATAERLMEQFAVNYEQRRAKYFFIVDDLFGQNRKETLRLCRMLRDYQRGTGFRFSITVQIRLDRARDSELLHAMREAGVNVLAIGFESPIAEELKAMRKCLKPEDMITLARLYHRAGFRMHGMFIFGYPAKGGEPFTMSANDRVKHFRRFIKKARIDTVQVLLPVPLPGTEMTHRLHAENRIYSTKHVGLEYYDGNFPLFEPDAPLTSETMQDAARKIMGHVYKPHWMISIGWNLLSFPAIAFLFHKAHAIRLRWHRRWIKSLYRMGGWLMMRRWAVAFKRDGFLDKLARAKKQLQSD